MTQPTHQFDTFLFDLDGTLLDTLPDLVLLTNRALEEFGLPVCSPQQILSYIGDGGRALIQRAVPAGTSEATVEDLFVRWKALYPEVGNKLTKPFPGIVDTLKELKARGCKLGVLSNKFDKGVHDVIGEFLPGYFDVLLGEGPEVPRKPNPLGMEKEMQMLGATPETTAFVGDSPTDMKTAQNARVFGIGVSWGYHHASELEAAGADAIAKQAADILQYAKK